MCRDLIYGIYCLCTNGITVHYWQVLSGKQRSRDFWNTSFDQLPSSGVAFWRRSASKAPTDFSPSSELEELLAHQERGEEAVNPAPWIQCCILGRQSQVKPIARQWVDDSFEHGAGFAVCVSSQSLISLFCCSCLSLSIAIWAVSCVHFRQLFPSVLRALFFEVVIGSLSLGGDAYYGVSNLGCGRWKLVSGIWDDYGFMMFHGYEPSKFVQSLGNIWKYVAKNCDPSGLIKELLMSVWWKELH